MGKHILLLRFSSMGDLAILEPVLRNFLAQYPDCRLTLVSRPKFEPIFAPIERLEYFPVDFDHQFKGFLGLWRLATILQGLKADHILDLHHVLRTIILRQYFFLRWGKRIPFIDKGRAEKRALAARRVNKLRKPLKPTYQRYADLFEEIGLPISWELPLAAKSNYPKTAAVEAALREGRMIAIAPFGRYEEKSYPPDLLEVLIEKLIKKYSNLTIYLFGGGVEQEAYFNKWMERWPETVQNVAGRFNLAEELALMAELELMIAVDSANMHFAAMLELPVISLWGPTHPYFGFYPWQQPIERALIADLEQYPSLPSSMNGKNTHPGTENCMRSISVEQIIAQVERLLRP